MAATPSTAGSVPYSVAARELLRNTLLDAACTQLRSRPWADVTMANIARAAGISRQTLYNEFGSRDGFAQALAMREIDRLMRSVEEAVNANRDAPIPALAAAFDVFLQAVDDDLPIQAIMLEQRVGEPCALRETGEASVIEHAVERLTGVISTSWPLVAHGSAEDLSEGVIRLAVSYVSLPRRSPTHMSAVSVAKLLGPYVEASTVRRA